jgi:hypothetical protein
VEKFNQMDNRSVVTMPFVADDQLIKQKVRHKKEDAKHDR